MLNEKIYKTVGSGGALSLVLGIVVLIVGAASGILLIVNGAKLLKSKGSILI